MLGNTNRIGFDILGQVGGFDLPQNAFVKRAIAFRLPRQFLVTNGCAIQCQRRALLFAERRLEIGLSSLRLGNGIAKNGWLGFGSAPQGIVRFAQSRFRCHHSGMLLLVTKSKRGDVGLDLGDVATRFAHQLCAGNTRDCDQHIDVVACLLDLLKLTFQTEPVCFGRGQFAAELL